MNDRLPGLTYDNPVWYGPWRLFLNEEAMGPHDRWFYIHDSYDGAPDSEDNRYGFGSSIAHCKEEIEDNFGPVLPQEDAELSQAFREDWDVWIAAWAVILLIIGLVGWMVWDLVQHAR